MKNLFFLPLFFVFFISSNSHAENICSSASSNADSGTIYDSGGASSNYSNYEDCGFLIQPSSSPSNITISFSQFSVEPFSWGSIWDYLEIYDGTNDSGSLLGRFYGYSLPGDVTATSGSMYLKFHSDGSVVESGFSASWTSSGSSTTCDSVEDDFSTLSYSNNDGSQNWTNAWQEVGESDGVSAGKARVRSDLCSSGYCLRLGTPFGTSPSSYTNHGVTRQVDLSGSSLATLSFNYFTGFASGTSSVTLSVSNNGGTNWTALQTYTISSTNFSANPESFDITPYVSANTQIRFLVSGSSSSVTGMYIDDIKIAYCQSSGGGSSCVTFRDEFSTESYSRQDGTTNWSTNWNEVSDNGAVSNGDIEISGNKLQLEGDGYGPTVLGAPYIERQADLSSYTTATLSFDYYETGNWENSDDIEIYVSSDGGSNWNLIHTFNNDQGSSTQQLSQDISAYIASNTRIAFVEKASSSSEVFFFDNVQIEACSAGGGGDTVATNFNCVENGTNGITGNLYTKTTVQSFSFDVVALQDASTIETNFASGADHTVTVELVNAETVASCDSYPALSPAVSQSLTFVSADSGTKASASMTSGTAYRKVKCRVTDATDSPSVIGCSTDSFAIRPTIMTISSNLTNTGSTGDPKVKAGESFTLTATATAGYNGTPVIDNSNIQAHAGAVQTGTISGSFSSANSATGIATGNTFNYSEVGLLQFTAQGVYDDSFTAVDQAGDCTDDFSNSVISGKIGCKFGNTSSSDYFGRFTPDHFKITGFTNGIFSDACTGFTYSGQPFSYQTAPTLTVTAYNGLGTPTVTANYTGSYDDGLDATDFNVTAPTTDSSQLGADGSTLVNLESWTSGTPTLADNGDGSLTFAFGTDSFIYQHESNSKIAPFTPTVDLIFTNITDSDGIQAQVLPHTIQASGTSIRFGRLNIDNAHGSELLPLNIQLTTEYYNGSEFVKNNDDNCTSFIHSEVFPLSDPEDNDFSISDPADSNCSLTTNTSPVSIGSTGQVKAVMTNTTVSSGATKITVSADTDVTKGPGAANTGYVEITSNLLTNLPWLRFDWDADSSHDNCPSARATFGIFKGNSKQIYFREVY